MTATLHLLMMFLTRKEDLADADNSVDAAADALVPAQGDFLHLVFSFAA